MQVLLYGLEDPCESCPIFFPSPKAFYTDLVFASAYAALLFIQIIAGSVLSRAKAKVESGQVPFCAFSHEPLRTHRTHTRAHTRTHALTHTIAHTPAHHRTRLRAHM
jgi:hypothetical protein